QLIQVVQTLRLELDEPAPCDHQSVQRVDDLSVVPIDLHPPHEVLVKVLETSKPDDREDGLPVPEHEHMNEKIHSAPTLKNRGIAWVDVDIVKRDVRTVLLQEELGALSQEVVADVLVAE